MNVLIDDILSVEELGSLIRNSLQLMILDFASNSVFFVCGHTLHYILGQLDLNLFRNIINSETSLQKMRTYSFPVRIVYTFLSSK